MLICASSIGRFKQNRANNAGADETAGRVRAVRPGSLIGNRTRKRVTTVGERSTDWSVAATRPKEPGAALGVPSTALKTSGRVPAEECGACPQRGPRPTPTPTTEVGRFRGAYSDSPSAVRWVFLLAHSFRQDRLHPGRHGRRVRAANELVTFQCGSHGNQSAGSRRDTRPRPFEPDNFPPAKQPDIDTRLGTG